MLSSEKYIRLFASVTRNNVRAHSNLSRSIMTFTRVKSPDYRDFLRERKTFSPSRDARESMEVTRREDIRVIVAEKFQDHASMANSPAGQIEHR